MELLWIVIVWWVCIVALLLFIASAAFAVHATVNFASDLLRRIRGRR